MDAILPNEVLASMRLRLSPQSNMTVDVCGKCTHLSFNEAAAFAAEQHTEVHRPIASLLAASMRLRLSPQSNWNCSRLTPARARMLQ